MADTPGIRPAATVLLLRDNPDLEVLMIRRHAMIDFVPGAMVFPGGKTSAADADPAWAGQVDGWQALPEDERALRIAALREAFEETGLIPGSPDAAVPDAMALRRAVEDGTLPFLTVMQRLGLRPDLARLIPFARWVTPPVVPKRFDTRFYLIRADTLPEVTVDGREAVAAEWIAPARALALAVAGQRQIVFPTRMNLQRLAESTTTAAAILAARARPARCVEPQVELRGDERWITLVPEDGYGPVAERLMAG